MGVGLTRSDNIIRRAVIHGSPNDRQSDRQVHAPTKRHGFERDQSLVVIHGHHDVIRSANGRPEQRIGRQGAGGLDSASSGQANRGPNDRLLFVTQDSVFACMWIERGDADTRTSDVEIVLHGLMSEVNGRHHALNRQGPGNLLKRQMRGHKQNF